MVVFDSLQEENTNHIQDFWNLDIDFNGLISIIWKLYGKAQRIQRM